jgi:tetratricopeptide (TPR) repeat protein
MRPFLTPFRPVMTTPHPLLQMPQHTAAPATGAWSALLTLACIALLIALPQRASAQAFGNPAPVQDQPSTVIAPFLGGFGPNEPPRLSPSAGYEPLPPELSETVALPFLSFLIIEPDPIVRNGIPTEIEKLVKAKKYPEAIKRIDELLVKNPHNVQLRFVQARIQIELRQFAAAQKTLIEITQQFPELAEPYNNLAALAANQGQWIEARDYLELALKLKPSYAIASANLGEVYTRLAAKSYIDAAKQRTNQREYQRRATALLGILKAPQNNTNSAVQSTPKPVTNPTESKPKNGASTPQNQ